MTPLLSSRPLTRVLGVVQAANVEAVVRALVYLVTRSLQQVLAGVVLARVDVERHVVLRAVAVVGEVAATLDVDEHVVIHVQRLHRGCRGR